MSGIELAWVPEGCSLPAVERPGRVAEFDALFARALRSQEWAGAALPFAGTSSGR